MSIVTNFTLTQYERMVEGGVFAGPQRQRLELIRGEIREMNPIGTPHSQAVIRLTTWSYQVCDIEKVQIRVQTALRIPQSESEPEPDVAWAIEKQYDPHHPEPQDVYLVIEVSDSSLHIDRVVKTQLYAEAGIRDYWIVDCVDRTVEVFREPSSDGYGHSQIYRDTEKIRPLAFPDAVFSPAMIFLK